MNRLDAAKLPWQCTLGGKSHMNIFGKIVLLPLILIFCIVISLCELCFASGNDLDA